VDDDKEGDCLPFKKVYLNNLWYKMYRIKSMVVLVVYRLNDSSQPHRIYQNTVQPQHTFLEGCHIQSQWKWPVLSGIQTRVIWFTVQCCTCWVTRLYYRIILKSTFINLFKSVFLLSIVKHENTISFQALFSITL
jgi:hypothetical protein